MGGLFDVNTGSSPYVIQGNWNATTNTPNLSGVTTANYAWVVSVAGSTNLGGITTWNLNDIAVKTLSGWTRILPSSATWGTIVGTLASQVDLKNALDLKATIVSVDLKQDKPTTAVENNIATFDTNKDTKDSGKLFITTINGSPTDLQIPTALATKTYVDNKTSPASDIFNDTNFNIHNTASPTKISKFDVSSVTVGQTRSIKTPDYDYDLNKPIVATTKYDITLNNPSYEEGLVFYDKNKHALSYYTNESEVTVNLGQEMLIYVKNMSGNPIVNGSAVYPSGTSGTDILIDLATASDKNKCRLIGIITHTIENNSYGYVTKFGEVSDVNTSSFNSGDVIYLSNTPGVITKNKPVGASFITQIGAVKIVSPTTGSIVVDINTTEFSVEASSVVGWSPNKLATISFTNTSPDRTLTISPVSTNFIFYQYGDQYTKTTDSIQLPNTEGLYLIYYNLGVLQYILKPTNSQLSTLLLNNPFVAYVYWNVTNSKQEYFANEMHQIGMSAATHLYLHFTNHMVYNFGLLPNNIVADGSGNSNASAQFGMDAGAVSDENIFYNINSILSTTGLPIKYLSGSAISPTLRSLTNSGYSVTTTGSGRLAYNLLTGGNWTIAEITNGDFVLCHVVAINSHDGAERIVAFMGQNLYTSVANARLGAQSELLNLELAGLLSEELKAIATFVFETQTGYTNAVKGRIRTISSGVNFIDWRNVKVAGTTLT